MKKLAYSLMFGLVSLTQAHAALTWVGNVYNCPRDGDINSTDDVWVYVESYLQSAAASARVVYNRSDNGTNWVSVEMSKAGTLGADDWWHVDLGTFPPGTKVQYACEVRDGSGGSLWDTNGGSNYWFTVNSFYWIGNTSQSPATGDFDPQDNLVITTETFPINGAGSVQLLYSGDCGTNWTQAAMSKIGTTGNNDRWQYNAGKFPCGACVHYKVEANFGSVGTLWDPNGGEFSTLETGAKPVGWIGNVTQSPPNGSLNSTNDLLVTIQATPINAATSAFVAFSTNGGTNWSSATMQRAGTSGTNEVWSADLGKFAANATILYACNVSGCTNTLWDSNYGANYKAIVNGIIPVPWIGETSHFPANGALTTADDLWINTKTRPLGAATSARVVWSVDGGTNWTSTVLTSAGNDGTSDLWHVDLGKFAPGTIVWYAVAGMFTSGEIWDTNNGANYRASVTPLLPVTWMGYTYTFPASGSINPSDDVWINTETAPIGAATSVSATYTTNGVDWTTVALTTNGVNSVHSLWHVKLGKFPEGTRIEFALQATGQTGNQDWDNNYFQNFYAVVNTIIRDVYTDRARYNPGDTAQISVVLSNANPSVATGQVQVKIRRLFDDAGSLTAPVTLNAWQGTTLSFNWTTWGDDFRGYSVDVDFLTNGVLRDSRSSAIDVSSTWTKFPRYGYFTDFYPGESQATSSNKTFALSKYHINVVQFYDWLWTHDRLLPYDCAGNLLDNFTDYGGGSRSLTVITNKINAAKSRAMSPVFYDLIYGDSGNNNGPEHITWAAFDGPNETQAKDVYDQFSEIWIMDVSNPNWQSWIFNQFKDAMLKLGFEGVHLDNLGGQWKYKYNSNQGISESVAFPSFIANCRAALQTVSTNVTVTENDVYAGYLDSVAPAATDIYYSEVWGWDHYADIRQLIQNAKAAGNGKAVVLAAYMNFNFAGCCPPTNEMNEASVRLMDACVFGNGGYHVELGEDGQMLSNYYWPSRTPMPATLPRVMRDYYDFVVRYENLLSFNTLGGISDGTSGANISSTTHSLTKTGQVNAVWTVAKLWRDEYDTVSLINLYGVDDLWRNISGNPQFQQNIQMKYYLDKKCEHLYLATPDDGLGRPVELSFTEGNDTGGYFVQFTVPSLKFWDLLIFDKTTKIKVDGWPGDWQGAVPSLIHQTAINVGEWIYTGDTNDFRTFVGASADEDITQVRVTSDDTYVYFLVKMQRIADASLPAIGIAWNSSANTAGNYSWIGDASKPVGSIGLTTNTQYATREIMFYTAGGAAKTRLYNGASWYAPPSSDSAIAISTTDNAIEARINKSDLGLTYPAKITMSLASFRSSGNEAGTNSTYNSPDNNNDAVDVMGGDVGVSANAWARDLSDNIVARYYQFVLDGAGVEPQTLQVAWPAYDGQAIYLGSNQIYQIVAQFSDTLVADLSKFTLKINGTTQPRAQYYFRDEVPPPFMHELRFDWMDTSQMTNRTFEVDYDDSSTGIHLQAFRLCRLNPDSVGDGIPDLWRQQYFNFLDRTNSLSCAACDPDGDGMNNLAEYLAGTNPTKTADALRIVKVTSSGQITWSSVPGKNYQVYVSTNMTTGFTLLSGTISASGTLTSYTDSSTGAGRFYRVRVVP